MHLDLVVRQRLQAQGWRPMRGALQFFADLGRRAAEGGTKLRDALIGHRSHCGFRYYAQVAKGLRLDPLHGSLVRLEAVQVAVDRARPARDVEDAVIEGHGSLPLRRGLGVGLHAQHVPRHVGAQFFAADPAASGPLDGWAMLCRHTAVCVEPWPNAPPIAEAQRGGKSGLSAELFGRPKQSGLGGGLRVHCVSLHAVDVNVYWQETP